MLTHRQIAAVTRIGMLTRERDTATACDQALQEPGRALPFDAVTLLGSDPLSGEHVQLAGVVCTAETSQALAAEFVSTPWCRNAARQGLPRSIAEDADDHPGPRFRHGWCYAERVRPAGFRDGLTGALRHEGRLVGLIHLSTEGADAYDSEARHLLASILAALGVLTDPTAHADGLGSLPSGEGAALVTADGLIDLPGRAPAESLRDLGFARRVEVLRAVRWAAVADAVAARLRLVPGRAAPVHGGTGCRPQRGPGA